MPARGPGRLTAKQDAFVLAYMELGSQRQAYRAAYKAERMSDAACDQAANELLKNPKVTLRLAELREIAVERTMITVESITAMLLEDRQAARAFGQYSVAVQAALGLAKLHGLIKPAETNLNAQFELKHKIVHEVIQGDVARADALKRELSDEIARQTRH